MIAAGMMKLPRSMMSRFDRRKARPTAVMIKATGQ